MATTSNVSVGKPKIGGGVSVAPTTITSSQMPSDASTALDSAFTNLGYVSEDGVTNSGIDAGTDINAWGGDVVLNVAGASADTFSLTFIESLNVNVLKEVFGADNVTGTLETGITVKANKTAPVARVWAIDMVMNNGALRRIVIPHGTITERGEVVYKDDEPIGYNVTILAAPDESGNTHYDYIKKA